MSRKRIYLNDKLKTLDTLKETRDLHVVLETMCRDPVNKMSKFTIMNGDRTAVDYEVLEFEDEEALLIFKLKYGHLL